LVCCTRIPHIKYKSHNIHKSKETFKKKNRVYLLSRKNITIINWKINHKHTNIHLVGNGIVITRIENQWVHYTAELHNCTLVTRPVWRAKCIVRDCLFLLLCWFYTPVGGALSRRTAVFKWWISTTKSLVTRHYPHLVFELLYCYYYFFEIIVVCFNTKIDRFFFYWLSNIKGNNGFPIVHIINT
jgi:hypothetical protein